MCLAVFPNHTAMLTCTGSSHISRRAHGAEPPDHHVRPLSRPLQPSIPELPLQHTSPSPRRLWFPGSADKHGGASGAGLRPVPELRRLRTRPIPPEHEGSVPHLEQLPDVGPGARQLGGSDRFRSLLCCGYNGSCAHHSLPHRRCGTGHLC